jgi:NADH-quinone oxidoreductase subunit A
MQNTVFPILPILLFIACVIGLAIVLLVVANVFNPVRPGRVKSMPYESGMNPFHDTRRRFDIRFHLLAIAFMVFDVELLFLYPWAVAMRPAAETAPPAAAIASQKPAGTTTEFAMPKTSAGFDKAVEKGWIESRNMIFLGAMAFIALLVLGFVYDWRKGVFHWR